MKSLCIKVNNNSIINYLIDKFSLMKLEHIYITSNSFKIYDNVIIHYSGYDIDLFYKSICSILTDTILKFYEHAALKRELNNNFFYFSYPEKNRILELCDEERSKASNFSTNKYFSIYNSFYQYIFQNHSLVLNGFFNFRLSEYHQLLDNLLNICVNKYLIEREYFELINILRLYINSNPSQSLSVDLIYLHNKILLLDSNKQIIDIKDSNSLSAKYLSDITFSENDYILNYLLTILPANIVIHAPDSIKDEFINTLELIFEDRVTFCSNCSICSLYFTFKI